MSPKSLVLVAIGVAVLAMGVYLFIQVRSSPAQAPGDRVAEHDVSSSPPRAAPPSPSSPALARPAPATIHVGNGSIEPTAAGSDDQANPKLDAMMQLANKAYDRGDYDDAASIAGKILIKDPSNVKMLRIIVSANCIQGDSAIAQQYYDKLPKFDRDKMKARCDRYGVTFKDPAQ